MPSFFAFLKSVFLAKRHDIIAMMTRDKERCSFEDGDSTLKATLI